jgi:hypothetical protein
MHVEQAVAGCSNDKITRQQKQGCACAHMQHAQCRLACSRYVAGSVHLHNLFSLKQAHQVGSYTTIVELQADATWSSSCHIWSSTLAHEQHSVEQHHRQPQHVCFGQKHVNTHRQQHVSISCRDVSCLAGNTSTVAATSGIGRC